MICLLRRGSVLHPGDVGCPEKRRTASIESTLCVLWRHHVIRMEVYQLYYIDYNINFKNLFYYMLLFAFKA